MSVGNDFDMEHELNLDFSKYARLFKANHDDFAGEKGFFVYQVQSLLDSSPRADAVSKDLKTMAEEGLLERNSIDGSKMTDQYILKTSDEYDSEIERYAAEELGWAES